MSATDLVFPVLLAASAVVGIGCVILGLLAERRQKRTRR